MVKFSEGSDVGLMLWSDKVQIVGGRLAEAVLPRILCGIHVVLLANRITVNSWWNLVIFKQQDLIQ